MNNSLKLLYAVLSFVITLCPELKSENQVDRQPFRFVRSICGSRGIQRADRFVIDDRRSVFHVPEDRQVVVCLELEGPIGNHKIDGFWKNLEGIISSLSAFSYTSKEKIFSSHFTLAILESAAIGTWILEVHIDGEFVSETKFQITEGTRPGVSIQSQKLLSPAEIYRRADASTAIIERIGHNKELLGASTGFVAGPGILITAFESIDGASRLRVIFPSGKRQETDQILFCDRHKGYSAIRVDADQIPTLPLAEENSWQIGDNAVFIDILPDGSRTISETKIVGKSNGLSGDRVNLSTSVSERAKGGALLNDYGEVIGIVDSLNYSWVISSSGGDLMSLASKPADEHGMAIPFHATNIKQFEPVTIEELVSTGKLIPPVSSRGNILSATLFSRRDGKIGVLVTWLPKEKLQGVANFLLCDSHNRLLIPSTIRTGRKVKFKPGKEVLTSWEFNVSLLPPGIYRIDVQVDGLPYWRTFFQIIV
jgi:hypothetical protein